MALAPLASGIPLESGRLQNLGMWKEIIIPVVLYGAASPRRTIQLEYFIFSDSLRVLEQLQLL